MVVAEHPSSEEHGECIEIHLLCMVVIDLPVRVPSQR